MVAIFKLIYFIIKAVFCKKSKYILSFYKENNKWYADIPNWPKKYHSNAEMVFGANRFLEHIAKGKDRVNLEIYPTNKQITPINGAYAILIKNASNLLNGAFYTPYCGGEFTEQIWICPVTLFFLGQYPNRIYIKIIENEKINY